MPIKTSVVPFFLAMNLEQPGGFHYVSTGKGHDTLCGPVDAGAFQYCARDRSLYVGQDALWKIYNNPKGGDAGMALVLAHELGHHLHTLAGVPQANTSRETIPRENQADCIADAWAAWADEQGYFVAGEGEEILGTLATLASVEGFNRDHGTRGERIEAVTNGVVGGIDKCSEDFSQYPLR